MDKLIPKLRFKEYSYNWRIKPLIDLSINGFSNGAFNDPRKVGSGYRIINVKDMYINGTINVDTLTRVAIDEQEFLKNRVEYGDIFFTRSSLVKEGIAYSNVNLNKVDDLTFDGHLIRLRPKGDQHSPVFLYYNFSTSRARQQFIKRGKTATMTTIGQKDISKVEIVFPTLPEQQKIASFLSSVDEKIQQLTRKKEMLEQYKKGVMQQLFKPSELGLEGLEDDRMADAKNPKIRSSYKSQFRQLRFRDKNGKEYPKWEEKKLEDICSFYSGGTPESTNRKFYSGTIPFIGSGNIYDSEVFSFISEDALNSSSAKLVEEGDLLFALYGANSGEVAISKINGAINQAVLCIRTNENTKYLFYILFLNQGRIVSKYLQGGQGNLSGNIVKKLKYKFPSLDEQQKIAAYLSVIDTKIENVSNQITQTQTFKKGLLQQMFV